MEYLRDGGTRGRLPEDGGLRARWPHEGISRSSPLGGHGGSYPRLDLRPHLRHRFFAGDSVDSDTSPVSPAFESSGLERSGTSRARDGRASVGRAETMVDEGVVRIEAVSGHGSSGPGIESSGGVIGN